MFLMTTEGRLNALGSAYEVPNLWLPGHGISHFDILKAHASTSLLSDQNKPVFHSQICDKSEKINMFSLRELVEIKTKRKKKMFLIS